jgi:hypothetical protein
VIFDVIPVLQVIGLAYVIKLIAPILSIAAHTVKLTVDELTSLNSNTVMIYNIYQTNERGNKIDPNETYEHVRYIARNYN